MIRKVKKIKGEPVQGYCMVLIEAMRYKLIEAINEELGGEDEEPDSLIFQVVEGGQLPYSRWYNH